jgi:endoglucanase
MKRQSELLATIALLVSASAVQAQSEPLTTANALAKLSPGINLGNTLEAIPTETSWGNPSPTDAYMQAVKKAGFRSIRIPVAWSQYADANNKISTKWMSHVTEVVRKATKLGLYAMINIHWDGGWMQPTFASQPAVNAKLQRFWTQIATNFRDFDDHLLFAGTNEVGVANVYSPPTPENAKVQNEFNQVFVNAVRATGGRNANRILVVQAYNTDIDNAVKFNAKLPGDTVNHRLIMEVHYYSPYNFTLNDKSSIWQWGKTATDPKATETWANEAYADAQFQKMKTTFIDKGIPVILGEYCSGMKPKYPGMDAYRKLWNAYITRSAFTHGLIPMYSDTGGLFNRTTGQPKDPDVIRSIVEGCKRP